MLAVFLKAFKVSHIGALPFLLWAIKEYLIKKLLIWQSGQPEVAYTLWRANRAWIARGQRQQRQKRQKVSSPVLPEKAVRNIFVSFIFVIDSEEQFDGFQKTLRSIQNQTLTNWEICLFVNDRLKNNEMLPAVGIEPRIQLSFFSEDQTALQFSRSIKMAQGTYLCWLQMGGTLIHQAMQAILNFSDLQPDCSLFYYDDDHYERNTPRFRAPFFKPGWSPELLLSVNYVHGGFYRRAYLIQHVLGEVSRPINEWDLALRYLEQHGTALRIAQVLYHLPERGLPDIRQEGSDPLKGYLERRGMRNPSVSSLSKGLPRLQWQTNRHHVSIVIPTINNLTYLKKCIQSIQTYGDSHDYEIILIDTGSQDADVLLYYQSLAAIPAIKILFDNQSFNYSRVNNLGAQQASGDILLFLNNDIEALEPGWLDELVRWMEFPEIGVVGPKLLFPDGSVQHAGIIIGMEGHSSHVFGGLCGDIQTPFGSIDWYRNYLAVTGACLMTRRDVFDKVGGFDESYKLVFSDVEYCLRVVQQGYRVMYTPFCKLIHYEGRSRGQSIPPEDIELGYQHFIEQVRAGDPYYHPGLSHSVRQPVLAWPFETRPSDRLEYIHRYAKSKLRQSSRK